MVAAVLIDVVIPCYNACATLARAVASVMAQPQVSRLWLVDDASSDQTLSLAGVLAAQHPEKITVLPLAQNGGAAAARNHGARASMADAIAFLDADDAYLPHALEPVHMALERLAHIGLIRLALQPVDFPDTYTDHAGFAKAWHVLQMTVGGNMVIRRPLLLACGGFPEDALFRRFGGEDVALGNALNQSTMVGTLFDEPGVQHYYRAGMHAERLLRAHLCDEHNADIAAEDHAHAHAVTARIRASLAQLRQSLQAGEHNVVPLLVERAPEA